MRLKTFRNTLILCFFILLPLVSNAQPVEQDPPVPGGGPVPLGGIEVLLVAGGALGIKKLIISSKKK